MVWPEGLNVMTQPRSALPLPAPGRAMADGVNGFRAGISTSSWPGSSRPSTSFMRLGTKDVDARDKPGHDAWEADRTNSDARSDPLAGRGAFAICERSAP
jgi:hypothetical protein